MNQLIKLNPSNLRVAHQSEILHLRRALAELQAEIEEIKNNMNANIINTNDRNVKLPVNGQHHFVSLRDIIYCEADGNYTNVFIDQSKKENVPTSVTRIFVSKTLKSVIDLIESDDFIRCHQSYLVNRKHVTGFDSKNGLLLKLTSEKNIPVSRRNKKMVLGMI